MKDKINTTNPDEVRNWEERIARLMGYKFDLIAGCRHKMWIEPNGYPTLTIDPPQYHKSLDGLFRVLRKIGFFTLVGDDSSGFDCYIEKKREWGARAFDTPEDAAFVAICHYLMDVHPTTAEEQERIEREAE